MQVHLAASIAFDLARIQELSRESDAEIDVDRAAAPLPRLKREDEMSRSLAGGQNSPDRGDSRSGVYEPGRSRILRCCRDCTRRRAHKQCPRWRLRT